MMPYLVLLLVSAMASNVVEGSQNGDATSPVAIRLKVTAEEDLRRRLTECLAQELGKDPQVRIAESPEAITFDVIAAEGRTPDGEVQGHLLYLGGYLPPVRDAASARSEDPAVLIKWQRLSVASPDLPSACEDAASEFRVEVIEVFRRDLDAFRNSLRKR